MRPAGVEKTGWTPAGKATLHVASLTSLFAALTRDRVPVTAAVILGFIVVGAVVAVRRDIPLWAEITPPVSVLHRRGNGQFSVHVTNHSPRVARRLSIILPTAAEGSAQRLPRLDPSEATTQTWVLSTPARGDHDIGPTLVEQTDLLRLRRRVTPAGDALRVRVYPAEHPASRIRTSNVSRPGAAAESPRLGSDSFRSLRAYVRGDDIRHVHWRTTARTGRTMVREFVELEARHVALFLDDRATAMSEEDFDEAVDVAASLVTAAVDANLGIDITTTSDRHTAAPGASAAHIRDFLACVRQVPATAATTSDVSGRVVITGTRAVTPIGARTTIEIEGESGQDAAAAIFRWNGGEFE